MRKWHRPSPSPFPTAVCRKPHSTWSPTMAALKLKVNVLTFNEIKAQKQQARQELFTKIFNVVKIVFIIFLVLLILLLIVRFHNKRSIKNASHASVQRRHGASSCNKTAAQQRSPSSSNPPRRKR